MGARARSQGCGCSGKIPTSVCCPCPPTQGNTMSLRSTLRKQRDPPEVGCLPSALLYKAASPWSPEPAARPMPMHQVQLLEGLLKMEICHMQAKQMKSAGESRRTLGLPSRRISGNQRLPKAFDLPRQLVEARTANAEGHPRVYPLGVNSVAPQRRAFFSILSRLPWQHNAAQGDGSKGSSATAN